MGAGCRTVNVTSPLLLLPGTGSATGDDTLAVFVIEVPLGTPQPTVTVIVRVACPPLGIDPRLAVILPLWFKHVPMLGAQETNPVLAGRLSVITTFEAALGPLLVTVSR